MKYLRQTKVKETNGRALVRLDFNTEDEWRMAATLPTLRFLLRRAEKIVIMSHRGRPQGIEKKFSLKKQGHDLEKLLGKKVIFISHFRFTEIEKTISSAPRGSIFLLENLRFLPGEEKNSLSLAKDLATLADFYVNDAFAVSHRDDASVHAIAKFLPSYVGLELERELTHLSHLMGQPKKPLVIVFGGGKAHDKIPVVRYFKKKADYFIVGGALANTLLRERGIDIGSSAADKSSSSVVREVAHYKNVVLPTDYKKNNGKILDIGPKSVKEMKKVIAKARTIIWNGPFGLIEDARFRAGTLGLAKAVVANKKAFSLAGGGETVMFLKKYKLDKGFSFISTGGGAMLAFLAGEKLPGIEALKKNKKHV